MTDITHNTNTTHTTAHITHITHNVIIDITHTTAHIKYNVITNTTRHNTQTQHQIAMYISTTDKKHHHKIYRKGVGEYCPIAEKFATTAKLRRAEKPTSGASRMNL